MYIKYSKHPPSLLKLIQRL